MESSKLCSLLIDWSLTLRQNLYIHKIEQATKLANDKSSLYDNELEPPLPYSFIQDRSHWAIKGKGEEMS